MTDDPRCDFCDASDPAWEYPVDVQVRTTSPVSGRTFDYGDRPWAACDVCAALIDEDRFGDLLERSLDAARRPEASPSDPLYGFGRAAMREQKAELFAQVATSHGPRRPLTW